LSRRPLLYTLILLMVFLWSGNYIAAKFALREFPPLLLCGLRMILAGAFLWPVYVWERRKRIEPWMPNEIAVLVGLGLFGVTLNQVFFVLGLSRTSVAHSAIIIGLIPILVLLVAAGMRMEKLTARKISGMLVALAGLVVLRAWPTGHESGSGATALGDFIIFLAGLTFALFTVFGKKVTHRHTAVQVNTFAYVTGALALSPATIWGMRRFPVASVSAGAWLALVYMALFSSVVAYLIYYHALTHIAASRLSAFSYLQPVVATLMAVPTLGEPITVPLLAGGAVIFAGVWMTERG